MKIVTLTQLGCWAVAFLGGLTFLATLIVGFPVSTSALQVEFAAASLPAFMIISFLLVTFLLRLRMSRCARILPSDIQMLRSRLYRLGRHLESAMGIETSLKFAVSLSSSLVYLKQKRGGMTVVLGDAFLRAASESETNGVLAHELAHVGHFRRKRTMSILTKEILAVQVISIVIPPVFIAIGFVFAIWSFLAMRMSWTMEYQADKEAAAILDPDTVIQGLRRLESLSVGGVSISHPSMSTRIKKLTAELQVDHRLAVRKFGDQSLIG